MDTEVTVVLPWRGGCNYRDRALAQVVAWYAENFPDWTLRLAFGRPDGPWCKADAVMPAIERARGDVVVVADADVICDGLATAVDAVSGGARWAVPHCNVLRLDENGTGLAERPYPGVVGGGIVVLRREVALACPLDSRFTGWGQEDECFGRALRCLYGDPWRGKADLIHFWHPPQERRSRAIGSDENWALRRRYRKASRDPAAMVALLQEAGCASSS